MFFFGKEKKNFIIYLNTSLQIIFIYSRCSNLASLEILIINEWHWFFVKKKTNFVILVF